MPSRVALGPRRICLARGRSRVRGRTRLKIPAGPPILLATPGRAALLCSDSIQRPSSASSSRPGSRRVSQFRAGTATRKLIPYKPRPTGSDLRSRLTSRVSVDICGPACVWFNHNVVASPYVGSVSTMMLPDRFKLPPKLPSGPAERCPLDAL